MVTNLVPFKCSNALPALRSTTRQHTLLLGQFPHLDRLIETAAHKQMSIGRECNRVDTVFVALAAFETFD
jgi:hypothetical protein